MTFIKELKRRNVVKIALAYLITSWLILQILSVLTPYLKLPEVFGSMVTVVVVIGFPIACLIAWAFELTPEGVKRSKDVVLDESITTITGRKLDFGIITALVIAVLFLGYEAYFSAPQNNAENLTVENQLSDNNLTSIAVLPFVNMSDDPEQEYFSDGLSEELLNVLARVQQLKVAARTSSFYFKDKNMDIKEIAEKLDVEHVLEGSVRRSGNKLRVTAQLIKAANGYHLWSETYDYEFDDIFKIQDEISAAVVQQLKVTLLNEELVVLTEHGTSNPEAQDAYLKGRYYMRSRTPESLAKAVEAFKYSITLDGQNQQAISGLVDSYSLQATYANLTNNDYLELAKPMLQPYMELKTNSAEMDTSIGAYYRSSNETEKSIEYFNKAISKNENYVQAYHWLGHLYRFEGQDKRKAKSNLLKALMLDPYSEVLLLSLFGVNYQSGNILEAENYLNLLNEIAPDGSHGNSVTLQYYWITGRDWQRAIDLIERSTIQKSQLNYDEQFEFYMAIDDLENAEKQIDAIDETHAYQANIVFNYQTLYLAQLDKGLQLSSMLKKKIIQYPHNDNISVEIDLFLRQQNYQAAYDLLDKKYHRLLGEESLHIRDLIPATYYIYLFNKLDKPIDEALNRAVMKKLNVYENMVTTPEFGSYFVASIYSLIGNNEMALAHLHKLYVEGDFYNYVVLTKHWIIFEELRKTEEMQNIMSIASQKLADKRAEFNASRMSMMTDTEQSQIEQQGQQAQGGNL